MPYELDKPLMLARTIRGLEAFGDQEITDNGWGRVEATGHREVFFTPSHITTELLDLKTVDDVFLVAAIISDIGTTKADLINFGNRLQTADFRLKLAAVSRWFPDYADRALPSELNVSASFLGKRNYTRFDIEDAIGAVLEQSTKGSYHTRRDGAIPPTESASWRVMIRDREAVIAVRLATAPLHRRPYKVASIPGTVHPPVAAVMARLAEIHSGHKVLDPCCGAGTILIEAANIEPGAHYHGRDISDESLTAARENSAGVDTVIWSQGDAGRLDLVSGSMDRVLVNPPWGQQVDSQKTLMHGRLALWSEIRRVLRDNGLLTALVHSPEDEEMMVKAGFVVQSRFPLSLFGSHPEIIVAELRR